MLTGDKADRLQNSRQQYRALGKRIFILLWEWIEAAESGKAIRDAKRTAASRSGAASLEEMARAGRFPRRDQIEPSMLGEDWANCLVIAVQSPVQLSHFVAVGDNLSGAHGPNSNLAGILLSHLPQVVSERRCVMIEGRARLHDIGILYRSALYPLSENGVAIDHLLGAANYRPLLENEKPMVPLIRTKWL
jgi:hypothetical protein